MTLYGEADLKERVVVVAEFKKVLTLYLGSLLVRGRGVGEVRVGQSLLSS
jgi:hypothetical protein